MNYEIKELGLGGVLDHSIRLYKANFRFIAMVSLLLVFPFLFLLCLAIESFTQSLEVLTASLTSYTESLEETGTGSSIDGGWYSLKMFGLVFLAWCAYFFALIFADGVVCYGIAQRYLGKALSLAEAFRYTMKRIGKLLLVSIIGTLGFMLGCLFFIIPGVYVVLILFITTPILMFEDISSMASLKRSRLLMKGHLSKALALLFILTLIGWAAGGVTGLVPVPFVAVLLSTMVSSLLMGFQMVNVTVFYFSARCKHENFDLQLLGQSFDSPQQDPPSDV